MTPIRRRPGLVVGLALALVVGGAVEASGAVRSPRLQRVRTWALAIGDRGLRGNLTARYYRLDYWPDWGE